MGKKHKKHHKKASETKAAKLEEPPIKLVLKVGNTEKNASEQRSKERDMPPDVHKSKEHSSRKKKKKRSTSKDRKKRKHADTAGDHGETSSTVEIIHERPKKKVKIDERKDNVQYDKPLIKKIHIKPIEPPKDHKKMKATVFHEDEPTPVIFCLANLHQTLQRKDVNGFFAYPVNDVIAPGYSSIITNPMDFSTMKYKIDKHVYSSLEEFKDDFNLMCNNAMIYNTADTIYYKAAKKLQQVGAKMMSVDKFRNLYRAMGLTRQEELTHSAKRHDEKSSEELIDVDTIDGSTVTLLPPPKKRDNRSRRKNTVGQKLQAKAEAAARRAAEKLAKKCPNSNIGFLRKESDGNTSLAILDPCSINAPQSIPVNLGVFTGKLSTGSLSTTLFQENKKNKATPVNYLKYGPFSSFSPSYDSSNATITKEDSDLLYSTYGDSTGTYYAQSLQAFVKDNLFAKDFVDHILDALTAGAHSKLMNRLNEKLREEEKKEREKEKAEKMAKKEAEEKKKAAADLANKNADNKKQSTQEAIDFGALLSLEKDGIDVSFLKNKESDERREVQKKLDETAELITKLDEVQSQRLSQANNDMNGATPKSALLPSDSEQSIAQKVTQQLAKLTSKIQPKDVIDDDSVRKATGVGDVSESLRKPLDEDLDEMEVHLAAEAIETVFNETTTMEDLDKVICEAAREVEDAMGIDVLDDLTASLDDVKRLDGM